MKKISPIVAISICAFALFTYSAPTQAAFDIAAWPFSRAIDVQDQWGPTSTYEGMVKLHLPKDFSFSTSDFSDLRIIDGQGSEVPFLVTRNMSSSVQSTTVSLLNVSMQSNGATEFIADTGQSGIVRTNINLMTLSPNFRRQVSVYASDSLLPLNDSRWSLITTKGYIFKFTDPYTGYTSGKNSLEFSANTSRYFKIVISPGQEGNVEVTGAAVQGSVSVSALTYSKEYPVSIFNNPTKKSTEITVDLGASGILTDALTLYPTDANYSRRVIVETSNVLSTTTTWSYIGQSSISHISTSVFQGSANRIQFSEQRSRYIRISIVNDDNPPLTIGHKALIEGPIISALFEIHSGKTYSLYYGNALARQPQYDIAHLSPYIIENNLPVVMPGPQMENPSYVAPKGPVVPFTESHGSLLNILLVIVVIGVGAAIVFYLRAYVKKAKNEGDAPSDGFVQQ